MVKKHKDLFDPVVVQRALSKILPEGFAHTAVEGVVDSTTQDCAASKEVTRYLNDEMPKYANLVACPVYTAQGKEGEPGYLSITITHVRGIFSEREIREIRETMLSKRVREEVCEILNQHFGWKCVRIGKGQHTSSDTAKYTWLIEPKIMPEQDI